MIKTFKDGNSIIKVRVESLGDLYRFVLDEFIKAETDFSDLFDEELVTLAKATPSKEDKFDEKTGNILAFRKARIKSNIKKAKILSNIANKLQEAAANINKKSYGLLSFVDKDQKYIKKHYNPDFNVNIY